KAAQEKEITDIDTMLRLRDLVINPIKNSSKETITKVENMDKTTKFYQNAKISHRYRRNKAERDEKIKPSVRTGLRLMQISPEKVVQSMKKAGLRIIMVDERSNGKDESKVLAYEQESAATKEANGIY
ncbi:19416_t:CDS:2, partial [Gigaspora rosea]